MDVKDYEKYGRHLKAPWQKRLNGTLRRLFSAMAIANRRRNLELRILTLKLIRQQLTAKRQNEFFSDAFTEEDTSNIPSFHIEDIRKPLEELDITEEKVKERLESLNPHKSPGPDGLHPRVLKELSNEISKPLAIIMLHNFPVIWY